MNSIGITAIVSMFSHVLFIYIAWVSLQALNVEKFVRKHKVTEARLFFILVAIALGTLVSNFVLDILRWSQDLIFLF